MNAINLLHELQDQGICLTLSGDNSLDVASTRQVTPETLKKIKSNKLGLISELQKRVYHGFNLAQLKESVDPGEWGFLQNNEAAITSYALSLNDSLLLKAGKTPDRWTNRVICKHCGPVMLWVNCAQYVLGCPYCHYRVAGGAQ